MTDGLLLIAHGSRDPRAAPVAHEVAAGVARSVPGLVAEAAFLEHAAPAPEEALDSLVDRGVDRVLVQPFLLGDAYHAGVDVPAVTARARYRGLEAIETPVLGTGSRVLDALHRRLEETGATYDTVVVAAAGSSHPPTNAAVEGLAGDLGRRIGVPVSAAYASAAAPTVEEEVTRAREVGASQVAVITYLLAPGFFADRIAGAARTAGATDVTEPLGAAREIVGLIVERARDAVHGQFRPYTVD